LQTVDDVVIDADDVIDDIDEDADPYADYEEIVAGLGEDDDDAYAEFAVGDEDEEFGDDDDD
jgi:hypothetical protein